MANVWMEPQCINTVACSGLARYSKSSADFDLQHVGLALQRISNLHLMDVEIFCRDLGYSVCFVFP